MNALKDINIWPEEPEQPSPPSITPTPAQASFTPWQQLQIEQNKRFKSMTETIRMEKLGKYYEEVVGDLDWSLDGICRCRVMGAPCYGRQHRQLVKLKIHLDSQRHKVWGDMLLAARQF